jgi:hypothetical protein
MAGPKNKKRWRYWLLAGLSLIAFLFIFLALVAERFVVPVLKDRLHTLIIQGSDSLYTYELGTLDASFLGGNVEISDLHIRVDSNHYKRLEAAQRLPSLTVKFDMERGRLRGLAILSLVFGKKISVQEIFSKDANLVLLRHRRPDTALQESVPLWKAMRPGLKKITIGEIRLEGTKFLYTNDDTALSVKLQFDTCNALFKNIQIDSLAAADTSRIGFAKNISLHFSDLKFRTPDSTYKLKAKLIEYSSRNRSLVVSEFKLQPTLKEKSGFYAAVKQQKSMTVIEYEKIAFTNFRLTEFLHNNAIVADSVLINDPVVNIYLDKTLPPVLDGKIGQYPHQQLLRAGSVIRIKGIALRNLRLSYTERAEKGGQEGTIILDRLNLRVSNVTNDPALIRQNNKCIANLDGLLQATSPVRASFTFYLDSAEGRFDAAGSIRNITAAQLNGLAEPLANTRLKSFNMRELRFSLKGDDYSASGDVHMLYDNLFVILQKTDEATGTVSTKKLLTKILNKYTLQSSNPGMDGRERVARGVVRSRLMTQPFLGLVWKTIYTGMQDIMTGQ